MRRIIRHTPPCFYPRIAGNEIRLRRLRCCLSNHRRLTTVSVAAVAASSAISSSAISSSAISAAAISSSAISAAAASAASSVD